MDMVGACNLLGVDVMTGHWEFTYMDEEVLKNIGAFKGDFVAQNVKVREEALFDYGLLTSGGFDEESGLAFKPYTMQEVGGVKVAVIGQAFPYTPIANPAALHPGLDLRHRRRRHAGAGGQDPRRRRSPTWWWSSPTTAWTWI